MREKLANEVAMRRIGTVEDIANLAAFLVSTRGNYITGTAIQVTAACFAAYVEVHSMAYVNMVTPELARHYTAAGLWTNKTFFEFIEQRAAAHPDREVFADATRRISYGALKDEILRCAELYRRIGIKRGDVVTVQLPNRTKFAVAFFALELIGAIANKVNPDFRARQLDTSPNFPAAALTSSRANFAASIIPPWPRACRSGARARAFDRRRHRDGRRQQPR